MAEFAAGVYMVIALVMFVMAIHMFRVNEREGWRDLHFFPAAVALIGAIMLCASIALAVSA